MIMMPLQCDITSGGNNTKQTDLSKIIAIIVIINLSKNKSLEVRLSTGNCFIIIFY